MTEGTKQQHTTNKEMKKYKIEHKTVSRFTATMFALCVDKDRISRLQDTILERYRRYGPIYRETIAGETVVHLLDPDYVQTVYQNEGKIPHLVPLMETTQMYRRLRHMSPGLGNTYVTTVYNVYGVELRSHRIRGDASQRNSRQRTVHAARSAVRRRALSACRKCTVKLAFHGADTDTDTDSPNRATVFTFDTRYFLARILARK